MTGLREVLDQHDTYLLSHPEDAGQVDRADTATLWTPSDAASMNATGRVVLTLMPVAAGGDAIAPAHIGWQGGSPRKPAQRLGVGESQAGCWQRFAPGWTPPASTLPRHN
jgi:hypothetical protein